MPGISQAGTSAGLVAGAFAGALLVDDGARLRPHRAAAGMVAVLLVILFAGALVV